MRLRVVLLLAAAACSNGPAVALPAGAPGIGFDDLRFSSRLGRVLAPGGRSGNLDLVDPESHEVSTVPGFATSDRYDGGHDFGVTSVDDTGTWLVATDRTRGVLDVVDPASGAIVQSASLSGNPDYVRWVASVSQAWVTEPGREAIEVFELVGDTPQSIATIHVAGGPESLVIDATHDRAYTHLWDGATVAIDVATRALVATWPNGCTASRGIALDEERGLLFAACSEGHVTALDTSDGRIVGEVWAADGLDVIDYDPTLRHLYLAGQFDATLAIVGVAASGEMALFGTAGTEVGAHCVVSAGGGRLFVCDPDGGQLLLRDDPFDAVDR